MQLELSPEGIAELEERTEGWVAGLQLVALSLSGRVDKARLIASFTGSHRYLVEYLMEEVVNRQPGGGAVISPVNIHPRAHLRSLVMR
jgi:LuxR family maltose regulon positive regulatory protein